MKKSELEELVKEAIEEVNQANLQEEWKAAKFLGGLAFVAALLAGNAKIYQDFYNKDPRIDQLEKSLLQAKADNDKEKIKDIARKLKDRKIAVTQFK